MDIWHAIFLGILQGLTEFLPVSSSGHLAVAMHLLHDLPDPETNTTFVVLVHAGTFLSLLLVFWRDLLRFLQKDWIVLTYLIVGTIPAAAIGLPFKKRLEESFTEMLPISICFLFTAALLWFANRKDGKEDDIEHVGWERTIWIGCMQAVALLPGISRSGSTISGGLMTGLTRSNATRFAFLLGIPAIGGAMVLKLRHLSELSTTLGWPVIGAAFVASFLSGIVAIWAVRWLASSKKLHWFSIYLCGASAFTFAVYCNVIQF